MAVPASVERKLDRAVEHLADLGRLTHEVTAGFERAEVWSAEDGGLRHAVRLEAPPAIPDRFSGVTLRHSRWSQPRSYWNTLRVPPVRGKPARVFKIRRPRLGKDPDFPTG